ncbi:MAG: GPW/gp25 family protein [Chloroflexales bacterium]|nr:GPW/gp25 family protein [Chloroflexales bacterium]
MLDLGNVLGRGISFPPRIGADGRMVWSEGEVNVRESVQIILMTDQNERLMLPEFGGNLGSFLFEPNTSTTCHAIQDRITKALTEWEQRIALETVNVVPDPADPQGAIATITYRLVATQSRERISVNVTLAV